MDTSIVDEASSPSSSSCFSNDEMYDSSSSCSLNDEMYDSSSSCSLNDMILYNVFLSCGEDTRKIFTDHLYWRLKHARVDVLIADENKPGGPKQRMEAIEQSMKAIEQSRIAVIIFSREYAFSIRCLVELEKIMECRRTLGQMVLPIFYHVDPKDVGKQIDSFLVLCHGVKDWEEMMQSWRKSLIEAANLSGLGVKDWEEMMQSWRKWEEMMQSWRKSQIEAANLSGLGVKDWEEMMQSWRKSLTEAANLSDLVLNSDGYHGVFVGKIVDEITRKLEQMRRCSH